MRYIENIFDVYECTIKNVSNLIENIEILYEMLYDAINTPTDELKLTHIKNDNIISVCLEVNMKYFKTIFKYVFTKKEMNNKLEILEKKIDYLIEKFVY